MSDYKTEELESAGTILGYEESEEICRLTHEAKDKLGRYILDILLVIGEQSNSEIKMCVDNSDQFPLKATIELSPIAIPFAGMLKRELGIGIGFGYGIDKNETNIIESWGTIYMSLNDEDLNDNRIPIPVVDGNWVKPKEN